MNTLPQNLSIKSFVKRFSLKNYYIEFNLKLDRKNSARILFILIEKKYRENQEDYIKRIGYGLEHQLINKRNKITTHTRKQILKKT